MNAVGSKCLSFQTESSERKFSINYFDTAVIRLTIMKDCTANATTVPELPGVDLPGAAGLRCGARSQFRRG